MFQKLTIYRFGGSPIDAGRLERRLQTATFEPTSPTQTLAVGFVPPRDDTSPLVENIGGHLIAAVMIERRNVPASAIQKHVDRQCEHIEQTTGRKPGKKERRQIKEDALLALLPQAFPKQVRVPLWFDRSRGLLAIGSTSQSVLDEAITALVRTAEDLILYPVQSNASPAGCMSAWLTFGEAPGAFDLGTECELRSEDETKAAVRYTNHHLVGQDVQRHLSEGKFPRRLGLNWNGRVSFRLSDTMAIDRLKMLDLVFSEKADEQADMFDSEVAIYTGELGAMLDDLVLELGGSTYAVRVIDPPPEHQRLIERRAAAERGQA